MNGQKTSDLNLLPKPAKVVAVHALSGLDFSVRKIAKILGIGKNSVGRYLKEVPDEDWGQFGDKIKKMVLIKEEEIAAKALAKIEEKIDRVCFRDLVGLYKAIRSLRRTTFPSMAIQQNIDGFQLTDEQLKRIVEAGGDER